MAPRKPQGTQASTTSDSNAPAQDASASNATAPDGEVQTLAAVTDDNGQVTPDSPQATPVAGIRVGVLDPRQYSNAGEGYQPGMVASSDVWLDLEGDKVVTKAPERGQVIAVKGSPVEPWAARLLADREFKG